MAFYGIILAGILGFLYWLGFSVNHLVIMSFFLGSIFLGAIVIADSGEEKKDTMYDDFGQAPKDIKDKT